jgi:hypothetical protein
MSKKRVLAPTRCLENSPSAKSIYLGGRPINLMRLAEYGMDHGYLSYILSGERTPSVAYGKKIAKCLGILREDGQPDFAGLLELIDERRATLQKAG